jgi:hypothetical protein
MTNNPQLKEDNDYEDWTTTTCGFDDGQEHRRQRVLT